MAAGAEPVRTEPAGAALPGWRLERHAPPPQVVWVTCGNVRNAALRAVVMPVWPQIAALLAAGESLVEVG